MTQDRPLSERLRAGQSIRLYHMAAEAAALESSLARKDEMLAEVRSRLTDPDCQGQGCMAQPLRDDLARKDKRIAALEAGLGRFGQHLCYPAPGRPGCRCGLDDLLTSSNEGDSG